ncbi:MarR family winged helix-turn-helix transcriptional regulator [Streptomyces sp. NPDC101118]|uniref:MarR family winged helix-turn-helix transcriptional regulator n=1 Tax=Streptomyces sp. NPDC101118 TaxID=3366109 RepID=UPI003819A4BB
MRPLDPQPDETAEELRIAVARLVRHLRAAASGSGVTLSQTSVLKRLDRAGPATSADLARAEAVRPQSLLATVGALEALGLVARTPHPTDGRRQLVGLTDAGRTWLRERHEAGRHRLAELIAERLDPEERRTLAEAVVLLRRLAED